MQRRYWCRGGDGAEEVMVQRRFLCKGGIGAEGAMVYKEVVVIY